MDVSTSNKIGVPSPLSNPEDQGPASTTLKQLETAKKRARSARACLVCRERKVKCDVTARYPEKCSNCAQFKIKCVLPEPRKRSSRKIRQYQREQGEGEEFVVVRAEGTTPSPPPPQNGGASVPPPPLNGLKSPSKSFLPPPTSAVPAFIHKDPRDDFPELYFQSVDPAQVLKNEVPVSAVQEYLGSSTPLMKQTILDYIEEKTRTQLFDVRRLTVTDFGYLQALGCFCLPEPSLYRRYIDRYFDIVHPQSPVLNKQQFLRDCGRLDRLESPRSLLLLQSVLFAGSRVYQEPGWTLAQKERQEQISKILNKRAKALFEAQIELEPIALLQSMLIFGNYWDSQLFNSKNGVYLNAKMAISTAHCMGVHRNHDDSPEFSTMEKRIYKRLWWCLFVKDTSTSFSFGRPWAIDLGASNVKMLTKEDLLDRIDGEETDEDSLSELEVEYCLHRIKLMQVTRKVVDSQKLIAGRNSNSSVSTLAILRDCDDAMAEWFENLPPNLKFNAAADTRTKSCNFFGAALALEYYTVLLLVHRSNILSCSVRKDGTLSDNNDVNDLYYPCWSITFKSAYIVTLIGDYFLKNDYVPIYTCFTIYSMWSAAVMMIYHLYNKDKTISDIANTAIKTCMSVLSETAKKWPAADFVYFNIKSVYEDQMKRMGLIRGILKAANRAVIRDSERIIGGKPGLSTSRILDESIKRYGAKKEAGYGMPTLSAERRTLTGTLNVPLNCDPAPPLMSMRSSAAASPAKMEAEQPVAEVAYNSELFSSLLPNQYGSDFGFVNQSQDRMSGIDISQIIGDNWIPSFDTSKFPDSTSPAEIDRISTFDELFDVLRFSDMGFYQ